VAQDIGVRAQREMEQGGLGTGREERAERKHRERKKLRREGEKMRITEEHCTTDKNQRRGGVRIG
jgi:hypothetical protein